MAPCLAGTVDQAKSTFEIIDDGAFSSVELQQIVEILNRLVSGEITTEHAQEQALSINPNAGRLFDIANWGENAQALLLTTIISSILTAFGIAVPAMLATPAPPTIITNITNITNINLAEPELPTNGTLRPAPRR